MKSKVGMIICLIGIVVCIGAVFGMIIINNQNNNQTQIPTEENNDIKDNNVVSDSNNNKNEEKVKIKIQEIIIDENGRKEGDKKEYFCNDGDIISYEGMMYSNLEFEVIEILESSVTLKAKSANRSNLYDIDGISTFDDGEEFTIKTEYPKTYASATASTGISYIITVEK